MKPNELFAKMFVSGRFFTIAIRKRTSDASFPPEKFSAEVVLPATRDRWFADPMLAEDQGTTYLFYEAVDGDHGHIEVARINDDCTISSPTVLLQDACHYSYPFVFRHEENWYMIPESSAAREVRLYRATAFPETWELQKVLLHKKAVDTTVFEENGELYLLTFFPEEHCERVVPHAYRFALTPEDARISEIPWETYDSLRVRGAGALIRDGSDLYRPAQISREQRYGDGVMFCRVSAADSYREVPAGELTAEMLQIPGCYADGLHTYSRSSRFEVIDIRCGVIDALKPLRKLWKKLKR